MSLTTEQKLAEAEQAYHDLQTGKAVRVIVDRNGERVEFTTANAQRLLAYIKELRVALGVSAIQNGPAQFLF
jgi:hypothetical protein